MNISFITQKPSDPSTVPDVFDKISSEMLRTLAEIAFVGNACGLWNHAEDIFNAIRSVRPNSEYPVISQALARITVGDYPYAIELLNNVALKINPKNTLAQSFLGVALKQSGNAHEGNRVLEYVVTQNEDPQSAHIAQAVLSEKS